MTTWLDVEKQEPLQGGAPSKRSAVGASDKEAKERELNHMIVTAQSLQITRQLMAIAWWTIMLPSAILAPGLATTRKHAEETKGKSGHKMGSPHVQLWRAVLKALIQYLGGTEALNSQLEIIQEHLTTMETAGPDLAHEHIRQARIREIKDPEYMILHYGISNLLPPLKAHAMETALHTCFKHMKAEVKVGTAPPSEAEKRLQTDIDNLKKELGKPIGRKKAQ